MQILQQGVPQVRSFFIVAAPVVALAPRCIRCEAPAVFFLCTDTGKRLEPQRGGFCRNCAPTQRHDEENNTLGTPASLEAIETASRGYDEARAAHTQRLLDLCTERDVLRTDLASMGNCTDDGAGINPHDERVTRERVAELDDLLIFDEEFSPEFAAN